MLKKIMFSIVAMGCFAGTLSAHIPNPLPVEFMVTKRWMSWTSDYDLGTREYNFGYVHRKFLSWTVQYEFYDIYDHLEARAKSRWFSWGATFDVTDFEGRDLGMVKERIFTFFPTFDLISPTGQKLAKTSLNFWGTKYTVKDPVTDEVIATLTRPFFRWKDDWTVTIVNQELFYKNQIDPRLFVIVMAFQSDREEWDRQRRAAAIIVDELDNQPRIATVAHNLNAKPLKNSKVEKNEEEQTELKNLKEQLAAYRKVIKKVEPEEEDVKIVEEAVEGKLKAIETAENEEQKQSLDEKTRMIRGFKVMMPMLDSDELTDSQKSALYLMMERFLPQN